MVLVFFDAKGIIYTNIVPRGQTKNTAYITKALAIFMKKMWKKRLELLNREWFFLWDNAPVHTAAAVQNWLAARDIQSRSFCTGPIRWISPQLTSSSSLR